MISGKQILIIGWLVDSKLPEKAMPSIWKFKNFKFSCACDRSFLIVNTLDVFSKNLPLIFQFFVRHNDHSFSRSLTTLNWFQYPWDSTWKIPERHGTVFKLVLNNNCHFNALMIECFVSKNWLVGVEEFLYLWTVRLAETISRGKQWRWIPSKFDCKCCVFGCLTVSRTLRRCWHKNPITKVEKIRDKSFPSLDIILKRGYFLSATNILHWGFGLEKVLIGYFPISIVVQCIEIPQR